MAEFKEKFACLSRST